MKGSLTAPLFCLALNGSSTNGNEHFAITYNSDSAVLTVESGP